MWTWSPAWQRGLRSSWLRDDGDGVQQQKSAFKWIMLKVHRLLHSYAHGFEQLINKPLFTPIILIAQALGFYWLNTNSEVDNLYLISQTIIIIARLDEPLATAPQLLTRI